MVEDTEALAQRIASMRDEELVAVLDSRGDYTAEAVQVAEPEAARRGGADQLRARAVSRSSDPAPKTALGRGEIAWPLGPLWHWLLPERERFTRYPMLRLIVSLLRLLILAFLVVPAGVIIALVLWAASPEPSSGPDELVAVIMLYLFLGLIALLAVQAVILVLVDTERNTRETGELLREMMAGKEQA